MLQTAINMFFFFVDSLPENCREWPKYVGSLPRIVFNVAIYNTAVVI
jgi:hypothetical protein